MAAVAWARGPYQFQGALLIACGFVLFPAALAVLGRFRLARILQVAPLNDAASAAGLRGDGGRATVSQMQFMGVPRQVRLSWRGWFYSFLAAAAFLFIGLILQQSLKNGFSPSQKQFSTNIFVALIFLYYLGVCVAFFRNRWIEWGLLKNGSLASGTVLEEHKMTRSLPRIVYGFQDATGREFRKRVTDFSGSLYEQMQVSVFYDRDNPERSLALEASVFTVRQDALWASNDKFR